MRSITSFFAHLRSCRGQHHWKCPCSSLNSHSVLFICLKISFSSSLHFCIKMRKSLPFYYFYSTPPLDFISTVSFSISWSIFYTHNRLHTGKKKAQQQKPLNFFFATWSPESIHPLLSFLMNKKNVLEIVIMNQIVYCPNDLNSAFPLTFSAFLKCTVQHRNYLITTWANAAWKFLYCHMNLTTI